MERFLALRDSDKIVPFQPREVPNGSEKRRSGGEIERFAAVHRYRVLDTLPEPTFEFTRLAAQVCQTPVAAISFIDRDRQGCKSQVGHGTSETPLDISICRHAVREPDTFIVEDMLGGERFRRAEERQRLLVAELNHRVKNTLAVVQPIAAQTMRRTTSMDGVETPQAVGFGTTLIQQTVVYDLGGNVDLAYSAEGFGCRMSIPWTAEIASALD